MDRTYRRHIQIIVKKIMSLSPDVILVGSNVSKHAIDLFVEVLFTSQDNV